MWYIKELSSKHYGTIVTDGRTEVRIWVGFKNYTPDEVSQREKDEGWGADSDYYYDHVESIYDLESAKVVADKLNEIWERNK